MMKKIARLVVLLILSVFGLAVFLLSGAVLFVSLPPGEDFVRNMARPRLEAYLGQTVRIGGFETDVFSRVHLRDVSVFQKSSDGEVTPLLQAKRATVRYALRDLFRRRFTVSSIRIEDALVNIEVDSSGKSNLPGFGRGGKPGKPGPVKFILETVSVENTVFRYTNHKIPLRASVHNISASLGKRLSGGFRFEAAADSVRFFFHDGMLAGSDLRGRGTLDGSVVGVEAATLGLPASMLAARDFQYRGGENPGMSGDFSLTGQPEYVSGFLRTAFSPSIPTLSGVISLRTSLLRSGGGLRIGYSLTSPHLVIERIHAAEPLAAEGVFLAGAWRRNTARIDTLFLHALGGTVRGRGAYSVADTAVRGVSVVFDGVSAARLQRFLGAGEGYAGTLTGRLAADGPITDPGRLAAAVFLRAMGPVYNSRTVPDIVGRAGLDRGVLRADITSGASSATVSANVTLARLNGEFAVQVGDLGEFAPVFGVSDLSGSFFAQGTLGGTFSAPDVTADVRSDSVNYANFLVRYLNGGVAYRGGELSFANLRVLGGVDSLSALRPPLRVDSLAGALEYAARVDGPITALRGEAEVLAKPLSYRGIGLDSAFVHAVVFDDTVRADRVIAEGDSLRLDASATVDYMRRSGTAGIDLRRKPAGGSPPDGGMLTVAFDMHDPDMLAATVRGDDVSVPFFRLFAPGLRDVDGTLSFTGRVAGTRRNPVADLTFQVLRPAYKSAYLDSIGGNVLLRDGVAGLDSLRMYRGPFYSAAAGSLVLTRTPAFFTVTRNSAVRFAARGAGFQLGWIGDLVPGVERIAGIASYDLVLSGSVGKPAPSGTADVAGFSMSPGQGAPSIGSANVHAALDNDVLTLAMTGGTILDQPFALDARVNYTPPGYSGNVGFSLSGDRVLDVSGTVTGERIQAAALVDSFNLAILGAFVPSLRDIAGVMNADLTVGGTFRSPRADGTANVRGFSLNVPGLDFPLRDGIADITLSPDRVVIDTMFVRSRNGTIRADGVIENILTPPVSGSITTRISNVLVRKEKLFSSRISDARLVFSGRGNAYLLSGNVTLGETRFFQNFTVQDLIRKITTPSAPGGGMPSVLSRIRLDLIVGADGTLYVDNNLADIRLRADLQVVGTAAAPIPTGRIVAVNGNIFYLDRTFKITEGTLEFADRTQINPQINVEAETTVSSLQAAGSGEYTVTLVLSGTLRSPAVSLSSNPPLDRPNIISLLTLGVTREQVGIGNASGDSTASIESVLTERAEMLASQQISGYIGSRVGSALGLEKVAIEGNLFNTGETSREGPRIVASKRLSERVEVTYSTAIRDLNDQGFRVNYDVSNTVSLQGETDSTGRTGLDLLYRFRFQ